MGTPRFGKRHLFIDERKSKKNRCKMLTNRLKLPEKPPIQVFTKYKNQDRTELYTQK
jgi:hypothetical protein